MFAISELGGWIQAQEMSCVSTHKIDSSFVEDDLKVCFLWKREKKEIV